ncbi:response regulator transcription factor [Slackia isoflavoniconvertens]|uniref:helix-turn-helix transcriptional regulator n=1 Tax=Slackia isoflavoniconvertens TaxID=572010 RepID=UPI003AB91DD9
MSKTQEDIPKPSWARIAGFACYQGFVYAAFYLGTNHQMQLGPFSVERAELLLTLAFMVAAFIGERLAPDVAERALSRSGTLAAFAAFMSAGAAISAAPGTTAAEVAAEGLLIGAPMALTLMAWGKTLGANPPRLAATEIFAATGIAAACCFALWFAPEEIGLALRCVLPFAGVAFMEIARHEQSGMSETMHPTPIKPARARTLSTRMLAGALIFGLAAGFVETYRSDPGSLSTPTLPYAMFIVALFCGGVLETLRASGERDTFSASYRIAFTLMLAGFLFAPVLVNVDITGDAIVLAGYLGLCAAFASLFCASAQLEGTSCALAFAQGFAVLYGGEALGIILANGLDATNSLNTTPYAAMATAGLAMVCAYVFLFTERDFSALSRVVDAAVDNTEDVKKAIAQAAALSARETEVLSLALRGRTNERIAQELFIAKSTADTHLRRIYSKCGVHSRQELLDLAEKTAASLRSRE